MSLATLLRHCEKRYADAYRTLNKGGLSRHQFVLLSTIRDHDGFDQTGLVTLTGIDRSTLSVMLVTLEQRGLIKRATFKEDARSNQVSITARGRTVCKFSEDAATQAEKDVLAGLAAAERTRLLALLSDVAGASIA